MSSILSLAKPKAPLVTRVWPQVDLLPPEVRAGRRLKQTKRLLVLGLLVVVLLAMLGWVFAKLALAGANQDLAQAQSETSRLTTEQGKYADVPKIQGELTRADSAIASATATEVLWKKYFEALRAVTPATVSYDTLDVTMSSDPTSATVSDPLQEPSVGQISFTARAKKLPDMAAWMDAVKAIPGFSDPWFTQATLTDQDGSVYYQVTGTIQVNSTALAHRFSATPADPTKSGSAKGGSAAPKPSPTQAATNGVNS